MRNKMDRRQFITSAGLPCAGLLLGKSNIAGALPSWFSSVAKDDTADLIDHVHIFEIKQAMHFRQLANHRIRCEICPRKCEVDHLERGFCGNRENRNGTYYVLAYSNPCSVHIDPIEKKPFFHYLPTSEALSISTAGCNMMCKFCQNWQISQFRPEQTENSYLPPAKVVEIAHDRAVPVLAYTYAEPVVYFEYMLDCAQLARQAGIRNVMVSAGFINSDPLRELTKALDAIKIDLKAFNQKYYQEVCSADLEPVLQCLQILHEEKIWFEIVYLVVPTLNDDLKSIRDMSVWIRQNLGSDVPLHYSRFQPTYMLKNLPPTPVATLEQIRHVSQDVGLNYVYIGNVWNHEGENTYCPSCGKILIRRIGYQILDNQIRAGKCGYCKREIAGVWQN